MWTLTTARHLVRKAADGGPLWDGTGWYDDVGAQPGWLADLRPDLPHHLVDR